MKKNDVNIKKAILYAGLNKDEFERVKDDYRANNKHIINGVCCMILVLFITLVIISFFLPETKINIALYSMSIGSMLMVLGLNHTLGTKCPKTLPVISALLAVIMYSFGTYRGVVAEPNEVCVTFAAVCLWIPLAFYGRPISFIIGQFIAATLYMVLAINLKPKDIWAKDLVNVLGFATVGILMNIQIMRIKASNIFNMMTLEQQTEDLKAAKDDADAANKAKTNFLANMSHEIRTPINTILGMNEMIIREPYSESVPDYLGNIKSAGATLLSLVDDLLDLTKIETGRMEIIPATYETSSLLNDLVNMSNLKAEGKGLKFSLSVDGSLPRILNGDEVRIKQAVTNLIDNAIDYTDEGEVSLTVAYRKLEDFVIGLKFVIEDTGVGMSQEKVNQLLEPYVELRKSYGRNLEEVGLGLMITRSILAMMDGDISIKSRVGHGTKVTIEVRQEVENWECMGNYEEAFKRLRDKNKKYKASLYAPNARILVVDDMPMNITVFVGLLKKTGLMIDTATSGKEALELCGTTRYDLIFLDHMMPEMDGVATLKNMRDRGVESPIVVLTANAILGAKEEYLADGFDEYLSKPIDPEQLEKMLIKLLPEDKVKSGSEETQGAISPASDENPLITRLRKEAGLDVEEGLKTSGDVETYLIVVEEFGNTIETTAGNIENSFEAEDITNYTIQVHGLKSIARIVGAMDLSELSRQMEMAGKAGDWEQIKNCTPGLLKIYRAMGPIITGIFAKEEKDLPVIDPGELADAIEFLKQGIDAYSLKTVQLVMDQLAEYKMPEDFEPIHKELKIKVSEVDFDGMKKLLCGF